MRGPRVLALGGLTLDWVRPPAEHGPSPGGNALYAAVGAWLAGCEAAVGAVIGEDYPDELLEPVSAAGIDLGPVRRVEGPSFRVLLDETVRPRRITYLPGSGHNDRLDPTPDQLPADLTATAVHLCPIPTASQQRLLAALPPEAGPVTLDTVVIPGEVEPGASALTELLRGCDVFLPSRDEVDQLWPGWSYAELAAVVPSRLVVKLGADGSIGVVGGRTFRVPAVPAEAVDTTGAGDAFCGAFAARLGRGDDLPVAMAWGSAAASLVIAEHGATHVLTPHAPSRTALRAERLLAPVV